MQDANRLRTSLLSNRLPAHGAWQLLPGAHLSRIIARAGYDWVCLDTEHGNITDNEMHESIQAISACGVSPIVRIPANEAWMVKRALDAGAHAVIAPLIYTVQDAENLVRWSKFPPAGTRGFGSPFSMGAFDGKGRLTEHDYLISANDALLTIAQIETKEAFDNVRMIAQVKGLDLLFIGPFDLGNNLGYPVEGDYAPELKDAIAKILQAATEAGKKCGIYCASGESAKQYAKQGFHMISVVDDTIALAEHMSQSLTQAKEL